MQPQDYPQAQQAMPGMPDRVNYVEAGQQAGTMLGNTAQPQRTVTVMESIHNRLDQLNAMLDASFDSIANSLERIGVPHPPSNPAQPPVTQRAENSPGAITLILDDLETLRRRADAAEYLASRLRLL